MLLRSISIATVCFVAACGDDGSGGSGAAGGSVAGGNGPVGAGSPQGGEGQGGSAGGEAPTGGSGIGGSSDAGSLVFHFNDGADDDYGMLTVLPPTFGEAELTLELWVKPNDTLPIGPGGGSSEQNWSEADPQPYGSGDWWYAGNFLIDGHGNAGNEAGTFDLQIYGGGRVRWLFHDGAQLWGVQAWPATDAPSLLDGNWHHIAAVRRFVGASDAQLELWVDGVQVGEELSSERTDMRFWWDDWSTFDPDEPGWFFGSEKISATGGGYWDDYKGNVAQLAFYDVARSAADLAESWQLPVDTEAPGLVGFYPFADLAGTESCDALSNGGCVALFPGAQSIWSSEGPPL